MSNQGDPDKIWQLNLAIPIRVGFLSALLAGILTVIFYFAKKVDQNDQYKDTLNFLIAALTASATVTTAVYAFKSIEQSADERKSERTLIYISRWNDLQYSPARKTATELHQLIKNQPDNQKEKYLLEHLEQYPAQRQDITNILNFLEEMALCIEKGIIKEDLLLGFYRFIVKTYCESFGIYITQRRRENKNSYKALTDLYERWKDL